MSGLSYYYCNRLIQKEMKTRFTILLAILLMTQGVFSQPPETNYEGTLIATGFRQSIPLPSAGPFNIGFNFSFFGNTYIPVLRKR